MDYPAGCGEATLEVLNRCAYSADLMTVGWSLTRFLLDQLVVGSLGGKKVGRWLEDGMGMAMAMGMAYGMGMDMEWVWVWHNHIILSRPW